MADAWPFYEFFAGGGMARLGLGAQWRCVFANEICPKKARAYRLNFGPSPELRVEDIRNLAASDLPGSAALAWASFPCQDLSLAGRGQGLRGQRSGTFTAFWDLMDALAQQQRRVPLVVVENVTGALTANGGRDFVAIMDCITRSGYLAGAVVIDAVHFVPQSRPRLFIVAAADTSGVPEVLLTPGPCAPWHTAALRTAYARLPRRVMEKWLWWKIPAPPPRRTQLADVLERAPQGIAWHAAEKTSRLLALMSEANMTKVREAQLTGRPVVGTAYKRMRVENGKKVQRAEARFDQISGCLRTPAGGSSRQSVLVIDGEDIRSRLLSGREAARLMGLPETYRLPEKYNEAYHVAGDGVVVPAVAWLERHLLHPLATVIDSKALSTCSDSVSCCS